MDEYSIEARAERIFSSKTKEYFAEVVSSYREENYRSAVVILWSVAICDLLFKLKHMVDMYGDPVAKKILEEVSNIQQANERSPEWEVKLVDLISERTNLLELADVENLSYLQKQRHLAAHPVLTQDLELHRPTKETVRALIRNTLDGILSKPPIYTRKIFDEFVKDLASSAPVLIDDATLRRYLESKYFTLTNKEVERSIFRSLWKLVFRLKNPDCDANRLINYRALEIIFNRNEPDMVPLISAERDYYSHIASEGEPVVYLVCLLSKKSAVYKELTDAAKIIIAHTIDTNVTAKCLGWFIMDSLEEHFEYLKKWIESDEHPELPDDSIHALKSISDSPEWESLTAKLLNSYYTSSRKFDQADSRFHKAIRPYLDDYGAEELIDFMQKVEGNNQTYDRRAATHDHRLVKSRCDVVLGNTFDYSPYPNFTDSLD